MITGCTIIDSKDRGSWTRSPPEPLLRPTHQRTANDQSGLLRRSMKALVHLTMGVLWACPCVARPEDPAAAAHPVDSPETSDVVVEAAEPQFVAPTGRDRIGRVWAPVLINGKGPYRLVLNTGSNSSALIARVAQTLELPPDEPVRLHGATGTAVVPTVAVERLEFGDLSVDPGKLPIVADVFGGAEGVLGSNGLFDKRVLIDFENDAIGIARSGRERIESGFIRIPLKLEQGGLLMVKVDIGRIRARAIIDTGAQQTIGNVALREALLQRPSAEQKKEGIVGVTLDVAQGDRIPSPPVEIGRLQISGLYVTFGDMAIFERLSLVREPAMLIGMDVLGTLDTLIIDYKMRELQVRKRGS